MRWREPLDEILGSRAKVRVLRALGQASAPLSGREIARRAALSHTGALRALQELETQGIVRPGPDPAGIRWGLNPEHTLVADGLGRLLAAESRLDDALAEWVTARAPRALSVALFGSAARGDDSPRSDLDVLVVLDDRADPDETFDALCDADSVLRFDRAVQPVVWTLSRLRRHARRGLPLLGRIRAEGRLLAGKPLEVLLQPRARRAG